MDCPPKKGRCREVAVSGASTVFVKAEILYNLKNQEVIN